MVPAFVVSMSHAKMRRPGFFCLAGEALLSADRSRVVPHYCWGLQAFFYELGGTFCGCPCNESSTIWGLYWELGPLILGISQTSIPALVLDGLCKQLKKGSAVLAFPCHEEASQEVDHIGAAGRRTQCLW